MVQMQTMVTVQVQDMNNMKASKLEAVDNLKGVDVISTKEVHTACGNEQKQYSNEAFVAQPVITTNAEDAASAPAPVAPVAPVAPTLSQRLFKAAKKSKAVSWIYLAKNSGFALYVYGILPHLCMPCFACWLSS